MLIAGKQKCRETDNNQHNNRRSTRHQRRHFLCVCHHLDNGSDISKPPKTVDQVEISTKVQKVSVFVHNQLQQGHTIRPEPVCILQEF